ncbi:serine hydrolase domain-containing protein [Desulfitobacterium sp. Sab5]|uniref:serine hydrolase domain-containing protein n=1 Tax=Desulfitobacterium nosdiversum TaxID=3375356 RepID=UPI003CE6723C
MKRIILIILTAITILASLTCVSGAEKKQNRLPSAQLQSTANEIANTLVSQYDVASVQYALIDNGKFILSGGKGGADKDDDQAITKDTMYGIGSVSKMYVSAATMMLVDRGILNLDEPLVTYIPEFKMADQRYKQITPRMLLNHSSGINGTCFGNTFLFDDFNTEIHKDVLASLQTQNLKANPGEIAVYCNDGFTLLEILVERLSGMTFTEFISKNISQPLGLKNTKTPLDDFDRTALAKTYMPMYKGALPTDAISAIGAGGIYSTAEEICRFGEVLMGKTGILSKKSAKAMLNEEYKKGIWPAEDENFFSYGLGWDSVHIYPLVGYHIRGAFKGGDTNLYHSVIIVVPKYNIAVAVASSGGSSIHDVMFASKILQEWMKEKGIIKEIQPDKTFTPPVKVDMPAYMQQYNGLYTASSGSSKKIEIKDGEFLMPALIGGLVPEQKFVYVGDDLFKSEDGSATVSFDQQKNGITYLKVSAYLTLPEVGQTFLTFYESQKVEPISLDTAVSKAWEKRIGKDYLVLTEKPSSQNLFIPLFPSKLMIDVKSGYVSGAKIVDENNAVNVVQIPVMAGRDTTDYKFYTENNMEYLQMYNMTFVNKADIPPMNCGETSTIIPANGYARWYQVNENSADKIMTVKMPPNAAFAVYDENNTCISCSTVNGNGPVKLPANGYIGFFGKASDTFSITLK